MKYPHGFGLVVPYAVTNTDGTTGMERSLLSTNDAVDRRAVKRILRGWIKQNLGRNLHPYEQRLLLKTVRRHDKPMKYMRTQ